MTVWDFMNIIKKEKKKKHCLLPSEYGGRYGGEVRMSRVHRRHYSQKRKK